MIYPGQRLRLAPERTARARPTLRAAPRGSATGIRPAAPTPPARRVRCRRSLRRPCTRLRRRAASGEPFHQRHRAAGPARRHRARDDARDDARGRARHRRHARGGAQCAGGARHGERGRLALADPGPADRPLLGRRPPSGRASTSPARAGQAVVAAADGVVVYSGAGLVGYGELIIVKHSDEWLSAYAHSRKRLVSEGTPVRSRPADRRTRPHRHQPGHAALRGTPQRQASRPAAGPPAPLAATPPL